MNILIFIDAYVFSGYLRALDVCPTHWDRRPRSAADVRSGPNAPPLPPPPRVQAFWKLGKVLSQAEERYSFNKVQRVKVNTNSKDELYSCKFLEKVLMSWLVTIWKRWDGNEKRRWASLRPTVSWRSCRLFRFDFTECLAGGATVSQCFVMHIGIFGRYTYVIQVLIIRKKCREF